MKTTLQNNPVATVLSHAYSATINTRNFAYDRFPSLSTKLNFPVISIGGLRAGGTGKTPVTQLIARHLVDACGRSVAILSRGYGRPTKKNVIVKPHEETSWELVGDEPFMLHSRNNVPEAWLGIGADRVSVAHELSRLMPAAGGGSAFILDDGFQHRRARRDLEIVCLSEGVLGDRLMPAGYLREPLRSLHRADIVLVIGAEEHAGALLGVADGIEEYLASSSSPPTTKKAHICAVLHQRPLHWVEARTGRTAEAPPLSSPVAITGIARPERFLAMLGRFSVTPSAEHKFPDHYKFKRNDIARIHDIYSYGVVTTEKDAVRLLSPEFSELIREAWYLKIGLSFADSGAGTRVLSAVAGAVA